MMMGVCLGLIHPSIHPLPIHGRRARQFGMEGPGGEEEEEPIQDNPVTAWNEEQVLFCGRV